MMNKTKNRILRTIAWMVYSFCVVGLLVKYVYFIPVLYEANCVLEGTLILIALPFMMVALFWYGNYMTNGIAPFKEEKEGEEKEKDGEKES